MRSLLILVVDAFPGGCVVGAAVVVGEKLRVELGVVKVFNVTV